MAYHPEPIDMSEIKLADDLMKLRERLAVNAHDFWAGRCLSKGWTYGPNRDDATRRHPDLVPYGDLPDSEKQYDRDAAMETLKAVIEYLYGGVETMANAFTETQLHRSLGRSLRVAALAGRK